MSYALAVNVLDEILEPLVDFLARPRDAQRVLALLQSRNCHAACIRRLRRSEQDLGVQEPLHSFRDSGHVRALAHPDDAIVQQHLRLVAADLVLRRGRKSQIAGHCPRALPRMVRAAKGLGVLPDAPAPLRLECLEPLELVGVDAVRVVDETVRIGRRDHLGAELNQLFDRVDRHVAGAGDDGHLALQAIAAHREHLAHEVDAAVAGGFGADQTAAEREALAGEDAGETVRQALVHAEHVADLAGSDADIARRHVRVLADMPRQLDHQGMAEAHDLAVGLVLGIEVGPALAAAHGQRREAVLQHLLEAQELQHAERHRRVEAHPPLVRPDRVVELDSPRAIRADVPATVLPRDAENDDPVRLGHPLEDLVVAVARVVATEGNDPVRDLPHGLMELALAGIPAAQAPHELLDFRADIFSGALGHAGFSLGIARDNSNIW